jgi:hypothetical protein
MKQIVFAIKGTTPLIMHNERLANPFDDLTKEIKAITGKRKKTEDDLHEMARLEWLGGLYHEDGKIIVPGYNVLAAIRDGGKLHKLGTAVKRAVLVQEDRLELAYDGPTTPAELFKDKNFVDVRSVKVGAARIMRCRPIFKSWGLCFTLLFDESVIQLDSIKRIVADAGALCGLGDYRPRFGRFEIAG